MMRVVNQWHEVTGARTRESEIERLLPERNGVDSRYKMKLNDQLFVTRIMLVDEQEWQEMKIEFCEEVEQ